MSDSSIPIRPARSRSIDPIEAAGDACGAAAATAAQRLLDPPLERLKRAQRMAWREVLWRARRRALELELDAALAAERAHLEYCIDCRCERFCDCVLPCERCAGVLKQLEHA